MNKYLLEQELFFTGIWWSRPQCCIYLVISTSWVKSMEIICLHVFIRSSYKENLLTKCCPSKTCDNAMEKKNIYFRGSISCSKANTEIVVDKMLHLTAERNVRQSVRTWGRQGSRTAEGAAEGKEAAASYCLDLLLQPWLLPGAAGELLLLILLLTSGHCKNSTGPLCWG